MTPLRRTGNVLWMLVILAAAGFCLTVLALLAASFGDVNAPIVRLLNLHAGRIILVEVAATASCALLALTIDRRYSLRTRSPSNARPTVVPQSADRDTPPTEGRG